MDNTSVGRLGTLLRQVQLVISDSDPPRLSTERQDLFNNICRLVFDEKIYQHLWDDSLLSQIDWLFRIESPASMFDHRMVELRERVQEARHVNDFFCRILDHDSAIEEVYESLNIISSVEPSLLVLLKTSDRLSAVRTAAVSEIRFGTVVKYFPDRGFGFIQDSTDSVDVFFHIKRIKDQEIPGIGAQAKYLREDGEKGSQAAKVWLRKERGLIHNLLQMESNAGASGITSTNKKNDWCRVLLKFCPIFRGHLYKIRRNCTTPLLPGCLTNPQHSAREGRRSLQRGEYAPWGNAGRRAASLSLSGSSRVAASRGRTLRPLCPGALVRSVHL